MTTPAAPNPISINDINIELGSPGTTLRTLNDTDVRTLAGAPFTTPGTTISLNDLRGKSKFAVTGGTVYTPGDGYKYFVFTSTGPLSIAGFGNIDYVAIGGGGGGGAVGNPGSTPWDGGGGGAGGYVAAPRSVTGPFNITVTIGAGGISNTPGNNTTIAFPAPNGGTITAGGGAAGGYGNNTNMPGPSAPLGSGGGAGGGGTGAPGGTGGPQGYPGGTSTNPGAGGGGGAGGAGSIAGPDPSFTTDGGTGGLSIQLSAPYRNIPGIGYPGPSGTHWFAGGGAGADGGLTQGGGSGVEATAAQSNSGSGGGGGGTYPAPGGTGGSGIVIIRHLI
jgi:hypothetical protein